MLELPVYLSLLLLLSLNLAPVLVLIIEQLLQHGIELGLLGVLLLDLPALLRLGHIRSLREPVLGVGLRVLGLELAASLLKILDLLLELTLSRVLQRLLVLSLASLLLLLALLLLHAAFIRVLHLRLVL